MRIETFSDVDAVPDPSTPASIIEVKSSYEVGCPGSADPAIPGTGGKEASIP